MELSVLLNALLLKCAELEFLRLWAEFHREIKSTELYYSPFGGLTLSLWIISSSAILIIQIESKSSFIGLSKY